MRKFARLFGVILLGTLTFLLTVVAATEDVLSGWIVNYAAGLAYGSMVCLYYGFGEYDE